MSTWLTFVKSEEADPFRLLSSTLSLHDHLLWSFSSHLLFLGRIPISKWSLKPNIKVQVFAPKIVPQNFNFSLLLEEKKNNFDLSV